MLDMYTLTWQACLDVFNASQRVAVSAMLHFNGKFHLSRVSMVSLDRLARTDLFSSKMSSVSQRKGGIIMLSLLLTTCAH